MRIAFWIISVALAISASGAEIKFNFDHCREGVAPTNFRSALFGKGDMGEWKLVADAVPSAEGAAKTNQQNVLTHSSRDLTSERYPMFVYDGEVFRDFKFTTRFKIVGGIVEQMAGVVFRYQNPTNFYVVRASALGKNIRFYKIVNGAFTPPIGPEMIIPTDIWNTLTVQCEGNKINISLNGKSVIPEISDEFNSLTDGKVGFWTKADSDIRFADASVVYTPRITPAQRLVSRTLEKYPKILNMRIYTQDSTNTTRVIASKDAAEIGQAGTSAELAALRDGTVSFGRESGAVQLTLPLCDRNGDYMAAVRLKLKSFMGETEKNAVTRAAGIVKEMQAMCIGVADLRN